MFVSAKVHIAALEALASERGKRETLSLEVARLATQADWLYVRINQLEKERAILFREVTSLPIPVPEIVTNPVPTSADHILNHQSAKDIFAGCDDGSVTN